MKRGDGRTEDVGGECSSEDWHFLDRQIEQSHFVGDGAVLGLATPTLLCLCLLSLGVGWEGLVVVATEGI